MSARPALRYQGSDVAMVRPGAGSGSVVIVYLDPGGQSTGHTRTVRPHDLIGNGWHLAAIKAAIAALGAAPSPSALNPPTQRPRRPRALLSAHHAANALTDREG